MGEGTLLRASALVPVMAYQVRAGLSSCRSALVFDVPDGWTRSKDDANNTVLKSSLDRFPFLAKIVVRMTKSPSSMRQYLEAKLDKLQVGDVGRIQTLNPGKGIEGLFGGGTMEFGIQRQLVFYFLTNSNGMLQEFEYSVPFTYSPHDKENRDEFFKFLKTLDCK
jgi:hypothetical protein